MRRSPFVEGEWYHCYSRGVDKRIIFQHRQDYERYLQLLYLCNSVDVVHRSDLAAYSHAEILSMPRGNPLVSIGVFSLMPNHPHLLLKQVVPGGISQFIGKVHNAYTKYFNIKNDRVGNLLVNPFRAKHVPNDLYFKHLIKYILLNSAELFEPGWKEGRVKNIADLEKSLMEYPYSSIPEFWGIRRVESNILDLSEFPLLTTEIPPLADLLIETIHYFKDKTMSTPGVDQEA